MSCTLCLPACPQCPFLQCNNGLLCLVAAALSVCGSACLENEGSHVVLVVSMERIQEDNSDTGVTSACGLVLSCTFAHCD